MTDSTLTEKMDEIIAAAANADHAATDDFIKGSQNDLGARFQASYAVSRTNETLLSLISLGNLIGIPAEDLLETLTSALKEASRNEVILQAVILHKAAPSDSTAIVISHLDSLDNSQVQEMLEDARYAVEDFTLRA